MAEKEIEITLKWENDVSFSMKAKVGQNLPIVVIMTDENSHLADNWGNIASICQNYFAKTLKLIGDEMI